MRIAVMGIKRMPASAGADRVVERLLEHASDKRHYTVYVLRDRDVPPCRGHIHYVHIPALRGKHLRAASYFFLCCAHYVVKGDADLVHVHNSDFGLFCPLLKLRRGTRIVATFHGDPYRRGKWGRTARAILRLSEWLFVHCADALTSVSAERAVSDPRIQYIPNGLDRMSPRPPEAAAPAAPGADGEYVMFACGRLDRTKGLHHLLEAYGRLDTTRRLLVVGDFSHDLAYSATIREAAAKDPRVVLRDVLLDREDLFDAIRRCTVFVFPSEFEAMSMMLLEALACGVPVVCSDIAANVAVVGADYPFLFRSGDVASLRAVLDHTLRTPPPPADIARFRDDVAVRFRWPEITRQYEAVYDKVAASSPVARVRGVGRTNAHERAIARQHVERG